MNIPVLYQMRSLFVIIFVFLFVQLFGQQVSKHTAEEDISVVLSLIDSCESYLFDKNDIAYNFAQQVIDESERIGYPTGVVRGNLLKGNRWWSEMSWDSALFYYERAKTIAQEAGIGDLGVSATKNIGHVYQSRGFQDSAVHYFSEAVQLARQSGTKRKLALSLVSVGYAQKSSGEFALSAQAFSEAIRICEELSDTFLCGEAYSAFGVLYDLVDDNQKAIALMKKGASFFKAIGENMNLYAVYSNIAKMYSNDIPLPDSAFAYFELAKSHVPQSQQDKLDYIQLNHRGSLYIKIGQVDSALHNLQLAKQHPYNTIQSSFRESVLANLGVCYFKKNKLDSARHYLQQAYELAVNKGNLQVSINSLQQLIKLDTLRGNYRIASDRQFQLANLDNDLKIIEASHVLAKNQIEKDLIIAEFDFERLEIENNAQKQRIKTQNFYLTLVAGFLALLIALSIVLGIQNHAKQKAYKKLVSKNKEILNLYTKGAQAGALKENDPAPGTPYVASADQSSVLSKLNHLMVNEKKYLDSQLNATMLSDELGISRQSLSTLISAAFGVNLSEYINQFRILEAQRLLNEEAYSNYTIAAISDLCGFNTERTFYNAFRSITGVTPTYYIEQLRKNP